VGVFQVDRNAATAKILQHLFAQRVFLTRRDAQDDERISLAIKHLRFGASHAICGDRKRKGNRQLFLL
jgi:hypothetical protein